MNGAPLLAIIALVVAASCRSVGGASAEVSVVTADSVRGELAVVGAEPLTAIVLTPSGGGARLAMEGSQAAMMRGLSHLEVTAWGRRTQRRSAMSPDAMVFEADSFVVRAADGVAAHDGVVVRDSDRFFLVRGDSRLPLGYLPAALRERVGTRVFLVGPLDRAPVAYGVIETSR